MRNKNSRKPLVILFLAFISVYLIIQFSFLYGSLDLRPHRLTERGFLDLGQTQPIPKPLNERDAKILQEFRDRLPENSPYKKKIFGNEYTMDTVPFVDESAATYQSRVRKIPIKKDHLLVLIPSYRDPLCQNTIVNLFEKCKYCERITVALILQLNFTSDNEWDTKNPCVGDKFRENFHTLYIPSNITRGTVFARYAATKFWSGEEFVLGIDSHTEFIPAWDEKIIYDYKNVPNTVDIPKERRSYWLDKYMFTTYPFPMDVDSNYESKHTSDRVENFSEGVPYICSVNFNAGQGNSLQAGLFTQNQMMQRINKSNLSPSFLVGAGFMFGNYKFLWDVHFDPHAPFIWIGEEVTINLQLWTRGWNFFRPPRNYITHAYGGEHRGYVYGDLKWAIPMKEDSAQRVAYILGIRKELPQCIVSTRCLFELEEYSLGKVRNLSQWKKWTGIDMKKKTQENRCAQKFDYYLDEWVAW